MAIDRAKLAIPGMYADGNGLYLKVSTPTARSWIFRYQLDGRRREMGIGPFPLLTIHEARAKVAELRRMVKLDKIDPLMTLRAPKHPHAPEQTITFRKASELCIEALRHEWKSPKHEAQWNATLGTYAYPVLGSIPVGDIQTSHIMRVLEPIWATKTETASRVRQRIERVLGWAGAAGHRTGDNPAAWRGHLDNLLARPSRVQKKRPQPSLPYQQIKPFMAVLRASTGYAAKALEFGVLTAARPGEVRGATWQEIDLDARLWTIPAERMKSKKEHTIPLSDAAAQLLANTPRMGGNDHVFPGAGAKPLSDGAALQVIKRMNTPVVLWKDDKGAEIVPHGFRSTFRVWAGETTAHPREVIEHALAHQLPDKAEAAYARTTLLTKRAALMQDWANYLKDA